MTASADWDAFCTERGAHILQTQAWGKLKGGFGWQQLYVRTAKAGALLLLRRLPGPLGCIAYAPRGPVLDWSDASSVDACMESLHAASRAAGAILLKLEPDLPDTPENRARMAALGFRESAQTVQPPRSILIDLRGSEDDLLARMSQGTRRKVRTPYKKGVSFRLGSADDIPAFSALMQQTGTRNRFGVHSEAYLRAAYELFAPQGQVALIFAEFEGKPLAALMAHHFSGRAWYFYGASGSIERERMATYGLQWEAIRWARAQGCHTYDLWGVPDCEEAELEAQFQAREDGLWGVYGFKRGFGGQIARSLGAWDSVYRPAQAALYGLALRLRGAGLRA